MAKIFVVDDGANNITLIATCIEEHNKNHDVSVSLVPSDNVIEIIKKNAFNLVITDLEMGKDNDNGVEFAQKIKAVCPDVPIIIWTANKNFRIEEHSEIFVAKIQKPYKNASDVHSLLDKFLK